MVNSNFDRLPHAPEIHTDDDLCSCGSLNPQSARAGHAHLRWCALAPDLAADEWADRMLAEGDSRARMLGLVLVGLIVGVPVAVVALVWCLL